MNNLLNQYFSFIRRFLPEKDQTTQVGLDIGQHLCYMTELVDRGEHIELVRWGMEPIRQQNEAEAIKALLSQYDHKPAQLNTAVFGKGTLIRYIDVPRMSGEDLNKSIALEADKYFPFDPESVYLDSYILNPKTKDSVMSVLVAAVKRDMVDKRLELLNDMGIKPQFIGLNAMANVNAFQALGPQSEEGQQETCALIDVGADVTNMVILNEGIPRFTRDIYIGSHEFTRRIANALDVNFDEAQLLRESPGAKRQEVRDACESIFMNLFAEVRLSFDYFVTEKNLQVEKVYLMGEGALTADIDEVFQEQFDIPLALWSALQFIKIAEGIASEDITPHALKLNTAIGLALSHD